MTIPPPAPALIAATVDRILAEDLGPGGAAADLTAQLIPEGTQARATLITREDAILCGRPWFEAVIHRLAPGARLTWSADDGDQVRADQPLCHIQAPARALLSAERGAMNLLQTLSATATLTRRHVDALAGLTVRLLDTRKTLPGLRLEQKYAVRVGGGHNHRQGLHDAVLIKENHIAAAGGIAAALQQARRLVAGTPAWVEIEVESLDELRQALAAGAERILLDNFDLATLRQAVAVTAGRARLEASGGVDLAGIRAIAETGVDDISVGGLTKDLRAIDLSLRLAAS